ncbi:hypothetical protein [Salinisphaera sp. T5B8]|uniref:hypothetical protein n=1 Tax=Salinisphaera sp. T5B8 TaxID=1304154 RepID=UPI003342C83E
MPDDDPGTSAEAQQPEETAELNVPEPPPPADNGGSDIATNSEQKTVGSIFTTDSEPDKK